MDWPVDIFRALLQTPLAQLFVLFGVFFWLLAIAGSVAGKITVEPRKQKAAGLVGTAFIALGILLPYLPPALAPNAPQAPTSAATPTSPSVSQPTPSPAAASSAQAPAPQPSPSPVSV